MTRLSDTSHVDHHGGAEHLTGGTEKSADPQPSSIQGLFEGADGSLHGGARVAVAGNGGDGLTLECDANLAFGHV